MRTWLTTKVPLEETAGQITGVVTVSLDITQQKEAQKLNTLLATAVEHAGDVIEITDADEPIRVRQLGVRADLRVQSRRRARPDAVLAAHERSE